MIVPFRFCVFGSSEALNDNLNKLIHDLFALPWVLFQFDVLTIKSQQSKEHSFVERVGLEVTSQQFSDIDISEVFQC